MVRSWSAARAWALCCALTLAAACLPGLSPGQAGALEEVLDLVRAAAPGGPGEEQLGVPPYPGARWVDAPEGPAYFQGEHFLVEAALEEVEAFYLQAPRRFCRLAERYSRMETFSDFEAPVSRILCLEHPGEVRGGDDVVEIYLTVAGPDYGPQEGASAEAVWITIDRYRE